MRLLIVTFESRRDNFAALMTTLLRVNDNFAAVNQQPKVEPLNR